MQYPTLPDYGCFLRWPENGQSFIHPDDVAIVTHLIPSPRVFKRVQFDGTYYHYRYGSTGFRLRPAMWNKVQDEGIEIGDQVETVGTGFDREHFVATVWGMYFVARKGCILYRLKRADRVVPTLFASTHLRLLHDKATVRPANTRYRSPTWSGDGETVSDSILED
ncbi:DUF6960 family protein [Rhodopirellula sp. MGV]|uniref:DUF6960 family protein n=1 Tax=Rhodopirellula sp. MGV TaxID=2023130 RepID=UPI000B964E0C|nr:hypothetical protein [Rhodopirellula sp. MGV]OYP32391.1 hypothetical protein CGZ80_19470 [Rhodopirellula sp. MGV]PNY35992.1 hypothetical protein C2E31_16010 [Rhodopirellula baltica]